MLTTLSDLSDQGMSSCDLMLASSSWSLQWRHSSNCPGSQFWCELCHESPCTWHPHNATHLIMSHGPYLAFWSITEYIASSLCWWCDHVSAPGSLCRVIGSSLAPFKHLTPSPGPLCQCVTPCHPRHYRDNWYKHGNMRHGGSVYINIITSPGSGLPRVTVMMVLSLVRGRGEHHNIQTFTFSLDCPHQNSRDQKNFLLTNCQLCCRPVKISIFAT